MLERVTIPSRLALIHRKGETLGYNPRLNLWARLDGDTAEALRWLRAGRDRGLLAAHLARRFGASLAAAEARLAEILAWCVLRKLLYLDEEPAELALAHAHAGSPLMAVYWICTQACNLRCTYCYQDAAVARPDELSTAEARDLIDQTAEAGVPTFIFTGGEPFVRRDLLELAQYARDRGLRVHVITNGHYITAKNIEEVARSFHHVTISVDGTMEHHDRSRGQGTWARAVRAAELLLEAGVGLDINSVITKFGLADTGALLRLVQSWRVGEHRMVPQFPMGRGDGTRDDELSEDEILSLGDYLYRAGRTLAREAGAEHRPEGSYSAKGMRRHHCGFGLSEVSVDPEGWIYPCKLLQFPEFRADNVRARRLGEIYAQHPGLQRARARTADTLEPCKTCIIRNHCGGGCRGIHYSFTNDISRANPLFCAYLRNIFEVQAWASSGDVPPARRASWQLSGAPPAVEVIPASRLVRRQP